MTMLSLQFKKERHKWLLWLLNLFVFVYTIPYLIGLFNGKFIEGFEVALSALVFDFFLLPILIYYLIKNRKWEAKTLGLMMGVYTINSFLGPILSIVCSLIFSSIMMFVLFNRKN
jgi:hypothetical protein